MGDCALGQNYETRFARSDTTEVTVGRRRENVLEPESGPVDFTLEGLSNVRVPVVRRRAGSTNVHQCETCGKTFTRAFTLKTHVRVVHTREKPHACDLCGKAFAHKDNMKKHRFIHTGERPYGCDFCERTFVQRSCMRSHRKMHVRESAVFRRNPPSVPDAPTFETTGVYHQPSLPDTTPRVETHVRTISPTKATAERLVPVETIAPTPNELGPTTEKAPRKYSKPTKTRGAAKNRICPDCGKIFTRAFTLKSHIRVVHDKEKPFVCDICRKAFAHKDNMKKHRYIHTGEKPYGCSVCGKGFTQSSVLNTHLRTHARGTDFACGFCERVFKREIMLKRHEVIHAV